MTGMSAQVQIGQKVTLIDLENGFELALLAADDPSGLVVTEITGDHIVMEDVPAGSITRMPVYLIKAVRTPATAAAAAPTELPSAAA